MPFFLLFYVLSFLLTLSCSDWFMVWVGLELNMMSFIVLVYDRSSSSVETCMKYFFIQSLGSSILMLMFFTEFKWFEYISLSILSYKMGGGPFYFWFPSVCESLSWGSCFMLMTFQKVLPLMLITLVVSMFLWMIIMVSIIIGAIGSMNQKSLKRLMAYSSIHHIGWMLVGNFLNNTVWMIYLFIYGLMLMGVMMSVWKDKILEVGMLSKMSSKWSFSLGMLSMGGMPPMLGFFLKWWIFYNLLWVDYVYLLMMILMSVLMFYVYLRVVFMLMMGSKSLISWKINEGNKMMMGFDLLYIMGLNSGLVVWMMM